MQPIDRILREVDRAADEIVEFTADLCAFPPSIRRARNTTRARIFSATFWRVRAFERRVHRGRGRAEHTARYPRVNVDRHRGAAAAGRVVHLNGHIDVVPAGDGWTVDPFGGVVRDGRIYGRGVCDMKAGIAAAVFAAEAIERAGVALPGRSRSAARWTKRAAASPASRTSRRADASRRAHRLRDHPRAAQRRSHLHRPPRRVLVRGDSARPHRPRQHAVSRSSARSTA